MFDVMSLGSSSQLGFVVVISSFTFFFAGLEEEEEEEDIVSLVSKLKEAGRTLTLL
jgi:hypothetical protein